VRCPGAIGGKDVADTTRRIMRSLMTNRGSGIEGSYMLKYAKIVLLFF